MDIDAPEAWAIHQGTNGKVIMAVLDTGMSLRHGLFLKVAVTIRIGFGGYILVLL